MGLVRRRIGCVGERLWRLEDFSDLPFSAVTQSLSRLTREGTLERLRACLRSLYLTWREVADSYLQPELPGSNQEGWFREKRTRVTLL